jgi:hypothetical protein
MKEKRMPKKKEPSTIIVVKPDGTHKIEEIDKLSLERAQELVGGYVQVIPNFRIYDKMPCVVLADEEGKMKNKPVNNRATAYWKKAAGNIGMDMLVGDIVIVLGNARKSWG